MIALLHIKTQALEMAHKHQHMLPASFFCLCTYQPVIQVIQDHDTKRRRGARTASGPRQGPVFKLKPQKLPMTFPDRDLEVGILEVESGKPIAVVSLELSAFCISGSVPEGPRLGVGPHLVWVWRNNKE